MRLRLFTVYEMALTPRQAKAQALARFLKDIGAFVTTDLPLAPTRRLRFDVLHPDRNAVLAKLAEQDWVPTPCGIHQRFHCDQLLPCEAFELDLGMDDKPPVQDRNIYGEIASPKKSDSERQSALRYLGLGPKK